MRLILFLFIVTIFLVPIYFGFAQSAQVWIPTQKYLKVFDSTYGLMAPGLATSTTGCLGVDAQGWISASGSACGSGSGGSDFPFDPMYSGTINSTSTTLLFNNGFISSASSSIAGALAISGNTGIGYTIPVNKLDVGGSVSFGGFLGFMGNAAVDSTNYSLFGNTTLTLLNARSGASIGFRINNTDVANFTTTGGFGFGSTYYNLDPGQNKMIVESNLGVGSSSPGTLLSIGDGTTYINLDNTGTSTFSGGIYTNALQTNLPSCDSLDTNSVGAIVCGVDNSGSASPFAWTHITGENRNATSSILTFLNGFISQGSTTISDFLNVTGPLNASSTLHVTGNSNLNGLTLICTSCITDTNVADLALGGDVSGTLSASIVADNSHDHDSTTISGLDISADTNLTAGDGLTLTDDDLDCDISSGTVFGCLSSANWTTFNDKADLGSAMTGTFDGNDFAGGAIGAGDLLYGASAGSITELPIGTRGRILSVTTGGIPGWIATTTYSNGTGVDLTELGGNVTGSFDCSDVEGTGINCTGESITLDATGDWTGTFDGQQGTWYVDRANHSGTQLASTITGATFGAGNFVFPTNLLVTSVLNASSTAHIDGNITTLGNASSTSIGLTSKLYNSYTGTSTLLGGLSIGTSGLLVTNGGIVSQDTSTSSFTGGLSIGTSGLTISGGGIINTDAATSTFTGGIQTNALSTNLLSCDSLDTDSTGAIICGTDRGGFAWTHTTGQNFNATTSILSFNQGFSSKASSTVSADLKVFGKLGVGIVPTYLYHDTLLNGMVNYTSPVGSAEAVGRLFQTSFTSAPTRTTNVMLQIENVANFSVDPATKILNGLRIQNFTANNATAQASLTLQGLVFNVGHQGSGNIGTIEGIVGNAQNRNTGTAATVRGGRFQIQNINGGIITNGTTLAISAPLGNATISTFTNLTGLDIDDQGSASFIYTNPTIALNIDAQSTVKEFGVDDTLNALSIKVSGTATSTHAPAWSIGTTTANYTTGLTVDGQVSFGGDTPTLTQCGTNPVITGSNTAGRITWGSGGVEPTCIVTFTKAWKKIPACVITTGHPMNAIASTTLTSMQVVASSTKATSRIVNYHCFDVGSGPT